MVSLNGTYAGSSLGFGTELQSFLSARPCEMATGTEVRETESAWKTNTEGRLNSCAPITLTAHMTTPQNTHKMWLLLTWAEKKRKNTIHTPLGDF